MLIIQKYENTLSLKKNLNHLCKKKKKIIGASSFFDKVTVYQLQEDQVSHFSRKMTQTIMKTTDQLMYFFLNVFFSQPHSASCFS